MLIFLKRCKVNKNLWYLLLYNDFFHRAVAHLYDIQASLRLTYAMTIQVVVLSDICLLRSCRHSDSSWLWVTIRQSHDASKALPWIRINISIYGSSRHMKRNFCFIIHRREDCTASFRHLLCITIHVRQGITFRERIITYAHHAITDSYRDKASATVERIILYARHTIGNGD